MQGTEKTDETLNIFLEYVPGGSIASLLAKFGASLGANPHFPVAAGCVWGTGWQHDTVCDAT